MSKQRYVVMNTGRTDRWVVRDELLQELVDDGSGDIWRLEDEARRLADKLNTVGGASKLFAAQVKSLARLETLLTDAGYIIDKIRPSAGDKETLWTEVRLVFALKPEDWEE